MQQRNRLFSHDPHPAHALLFADFSVTRDATLFAYGGSVFVGVGAGTTDGPGEGAAVSSSVTISNSTFKGSAVHCAGAGSCGGGAVFVDIGSEDNVRSSIVVHDCSFSSNTVEGCSEAVKGVHHPPPPPPPLIRALTR